MKGLVKFIVLVVIIGLLAGGRPSLERLLGDVGSGVTGTATHQPGAAGPAGASTAAGPSEADCEHFKGVVKVYLDPSRYPYSVHHAKVAFAEGQPRVWHLDRADAEEHREADLAGMETNSEMDIDEMPPAATRESAGGKANVEYIPASDNRGAGASMGDQLRGYCEGQAWKLVLHAKPSG